MEYSEINFFAPFLQEHSGSAPVENLEGDRKCGEGRGKMSVQVCTRMGVYYKQGN